MASRPTTSRFPGPTRRPLRLGYVALTDAAPLLVARELDLFGRHGLRVELSQEIGWATIRDKVAYRELDGAHALAGMLIAARLGAGCSPANVLTGLALSAHGNAITLSKDLVDADADIAATLRATARQRSGENRLTLGVVFVWSSHHIQIRQWLYSIGLHPDRDVRIVTVPPAQMFRNLAAGTIDGFCAGEPWNSLCVAEGSGRIVAVSAQFDPGHLEKVLMVHRDFATDRADDHHRLITALVEACRWCDDLQNRRTLVELLAGSTGLNLPRDALAPALLGPLRYGRGRMISGEDFLTFHRGNTNVPSPRRAEPVLRAMAQAGLIAPESENQITIVDELFRDDIYFQATGKPSQHAIKTV